MRTNRSDKNKKKADYVNELFRLNNTSLNSNFIYDILIVGGGASAIYFALILDKMLRSRGVSLSILIVEQNRELLKKIPATGNGRANLGNKNIKSDLYFSLCERRSNVINELLKSDEDDLEVFLQDLDIYTRVEESRIYPSSLRAKLYQKVLLQEIENNYIDYYCACLFLRFESKNNIFFSEIEFLNEEYQKLKQDNIIKSRYLVFAPGGVFTPQFGDGYVANSIIDELSLYKNKRKAGLSSIKVLNTQDYSLLNGQRLQVLCDLINLKEDFHVCNFGELLFNKNNLSGISIMDFSSLRDIDKSNHFFKQRVKDKEKIEIIRLLSSFNLKLKKYTVSQNQNYDLVVIDLMSNIIFRDLKKDNIELIGNGLNKYLNGANYKVLLYEFISRLIKRVKKFQNKSNASVYKTLSNEFIKDLLLPYYDEKIIDYILSEYKSINNKKLLFYEIMEVLSSNSDNDYSNILNQFLYEFDADLKMNLFILILIMRNIIFILGENNVSQCQITVGGVNLANLDPDNLNLKNNPNIYLIGEVLDVNGLCGGYNLNFAYLSAKNIAKRIFNREIE